MVSISTYLDSSKADSTSVANTTLELLSQGGLRPRMGVTAGGGEALVAKRLLHESGPSVFCERNTASPAAPNPSRVSAWRSATGNGQIGEISQADDLH